MKLDVLLPNQSSYSVLHYFTHKVYEALQRLGHSCRLLAGKDRFDMTLQDPPELLMGFNGILQTDTELSWCDLLQVPYVSMLVDPPFYYPELQQSSYVTVACDDRCYVNSFFATTVPRMLFMPLAIEADFPMVPAQERPYDVTFFASYIDAEERRAYWQQRYPKPLFEVMLASCNLFLADDSTSLIDAFEKCYNEHLAATGEGLAFSISEMLVEIERQLKATQRIDLIKSIKDAEVHLFTPLASVPQWQKVLNGQSNVVYHEELPFGACLEVLKQSKIVLSSSIKKAGFQERMLYGLASGALVFANDNDFVQESFVDGESIALYSHRHLSELNDKINHHMTHAGDCRRISNQGREVVMQHHTWDVRMSELLSQF